MLTTLVICVYAGLFFYHASKSGQTQWILATIGLGLGFIWLLANLLPGFIYHHAMLFFYLLPFWVSLGSLFFFVNHWRYHGATQMFYAEPPCSAYLMYLALTGMTLHLAWLIPVGWSLYQYPDGLSHYALMGLLEMYFLQPVYWMVMQWTIMAMLAWSQRWRATSVAVLSWNQIQVTFLAAILAMVVYVMNDLTKYLG